MAVVEVAGEEEDGRSSTVGLGWVTAGPNPVVSGRRPSAFFRFPPRAFRSRRL